MNTEIQLVTFCAAFFALGLVVGVLLVAFLKGSAAEDDSLDSQRLNFVHANHMTVACSPTFESWSVLDPSHEAFALGLTPRQAIDRAKELLEEGR